MNPITRYTIVDGRDVERTTDTGDAADASDDGATVTAEILATDE
jgi:hypothetical protein